MNSARRVRPRPSTSCRIRSPPYLFIDFPTNGAVLTDEQHAGRRARRRRAERFPRSERDGQRPTRQRRCRHRSERHLSARCRRSARARHQRNDSRGHRSPGQLRPPNTVTVIRREPVGPRLLAISGDLQETNILASLAEPLVVKVTQENGAPYRQTDLVNFHVTRSDGRLLPVNTNQLAADITSRPDYSSNGAMFLQICHRCQRRSARLVDDGHGRRPREQSRDRVEREHWPTRCSSARPRWPCLPAKSTSVRATISAAKPSGPRAEPLKVWVSDGNNPAGRNSGDLPCAARRRHVGADRCGDGASPAGPGLRAAEPRLGAALCSARWPEPHRRSAGDDEVTVFTSMTGHAEVDFTYGPLAGNQIVEATFPGIQRPADRFFRSTRSPASRASRLVSLGSIQDNAVQPIGGAWVELEVAGAHYQTTSDAQGRFAFSDIASGAGHLKVDGSSARPSARTRSRRTPSRRCNTPIAVVPNAENSLPAPVLLPRLNSNNAALVLRHQRYRADLRGRSPA